MKDTYHWYRIGEKENSMKTECPYYNEVSWNLRIEMILAFLKIPKDERPSTQPNFTYLCNLGYHSVFGNIDSEDTRDVEFLKNGWTNPQDDKAYPYQTYIAEDEYGMIHFYERWSEECYIGLKKAAKTRYAGKTKDQIDDQFGQDFRDIMGYFNWMYYGTQVIKRKGCRYSITQFIPKAPPKYADWSELPNFEDYTRYNIDFITGELSASPTYGGPLNIEHQDAIDTLTRINTLGLVTTDGQNRDEYMRDAFKIRQRWYLTGFMTLNQWNRVKEKINNAFYYIVEYIQPTDYTIERNFDTRLEDECWTYTNQHCTYGPYEEMYDEYYFPTSPAEPSFLISGEYVKLTLFEDWGSTKDPYQVLISILEENTNSNPKRKSNPASSLGAIALAGLAGFLIGKK